MTEIRDIDLRHGGTLLRGQVAVPPGPGPHPAVLVMHSAVGLRAFYRDKAAELAGHGYVTIATDMYGADADIATESGFAPLFANISANPVLLRERVAAWFDAAAALPEVDPARIAAIGYCFGGQCVLELARSGAEVQVVASYHGLLTTHAPAGRGAIKAHVALFCGGEDPYAPAADIATIQAELDAAGATCSLTIYGKVGHGFTDPDASRLGRPGIAYDAVADKTSWAATLALLEQFLRPAAGARQT